MMPPCPEFLHMSFEEAEKFCNDRNDYKFEWCEELHLFHILKRIRLPRNQVSVM